MSNFLNNYPEAITICIAVLLFLNPTNNNKKGVLFLSLSFFLIYLENISFQFINELYDDYVFSFLISLTVLSFYLSIFFYINPRSKISQINIILFVFPFTSVLSIFLNFNLFSFSYCTNIILVLYFSINEIKLHQKNILNYYSNETRVNLRWLKFLIIFLVIMGVTEIINILCLLPDQKFNLIFDFIFILCTFSIGYFGLKQIEIYPKNIEIIEIYTKDKRFSNDLIDNNKKIIPENEKNRILKHIQKNKSFLNFELNISILASELELTSHQLSFIINKGFNANFNQFINNFRVEESKKLLIDPKYSNYTIESIGFESGFNSKVTFNTTFKKLVGKTPTEFKSEGLKI